MTDYILKIKTLYTISPTYRHWSLSDIICVFDRGHILICRKSKGEREHLSTTDTVPTVISILKIEDTITEIKQWVFSGSEGGPEQFNQSALELNSFLNYYQTLNHLEALD